MRRILKIECPSCWSSVWELYRFLKQANNETQYGRIMNVMIEAEDIKSKDTMRIRMDAISSFVEEAIRDKAREIDGKLRISFEREVAG